MKLIAEFTPEELKDFCKNNPEFRTRFNLPTNYEIRCVGDNKETSKETSDKELFSNYTPYQAYTYACENNITGNKVLEEIISKEAKYSYYYARSVIKERFELGENAISKDPYFSMNYAREVIKGRFELGEDTIYKCAETAYKYARDVIKGRWVKAEGFIAESNFAYAYARDVIKGRFELGECNIFNEFHKKRDYLDMLDTLKYGKSPVQLSSLGKKLSATDEDIVAKSAFASYVYANNMKKRFPKGEDAIATDPHYSFVYARDVLKGRFQKGEDMIATDASTSFHYASQILKGRFVKGEKTIAKDENLYKGYKRNFIDKKKK